MKKLMTIVLIFGLAGALFGSTTPLEFYLASSNGYDVKITASITSFIVETPNCKDGFNYEYTVDYDVEYSGNNIPSGMWTLQGNLLCGDKKHWFDIPVNAKGEGSLVTRQNIWTKRTDCESATLESFNCTDIEIIIHGPGINHQILKGNPVTLPITLESFSAAKSGNDIEVKWSTFSEIDNDFFTIERSSDGKNFVEIHTENGRGTSYAKSEYLFIDESPLFGANYYRLKQTDFDGKFEYFNIVLVNNTTSMSSRIVAYPNPFADMIRIKNLPSEGGTVTIKTMQGTTVHESAQYSFEASVDMQSLAGGVYIMILKDASGAVIHSERIVKNI